MKNVNWSLKDRSDFLIRLGTLLSKGYTIDSAIYMLSHHQKQSVQQLLQEAIRQLESGEALHEVFAFLAFPPDITAYVYFSEAHGQLSFGVLQAGELMQKREAYKERFMQICKYPLLLMWLTAMIGFFMTKFLLPQFQTIYTSLNIELPWLTKLFLAWINELPSLMTIMILLAIVCATATWLYLRRLPKEERWSFWLKLPILQTILPLLFSHSFSFHFGCLLKSGMSINQALAVFERQSHLSFFQIEARRLKQELMFGQSLDEAFLSRKGYVKELAGVILHGQASGYLDQELIHYSELLLHILEKKVKRWFQFIQPFVFSIVGTAMFFLFLSLFLPMFQLLNGIGG